MKKLIFLFGLVFILSSCNNVDIPTNCDSGIGKVNYLQRKYVKVIANPGNQYELFVRDSLNKEYFINYNSGVCTDFNKMELFR